jgi:membrane carboxypeptidase/penicillin-binding protein
MPAVPSMALGTGDVSVLSMTSAYSAFANGGRVAEPAAIRRVQNRYGEVIFKNADAPQPVISESTAFLMAQMLADVINSGTGYRVRQEGFTVPAGGKTGTTDDYRDAWFAGFTTSLVTTVWIGFDQPQQILPNGFAGDLAAPLWGRFMRAATQNRGRDWLRQPANVVGVKICRISGQLPGSGCSHVLTLDRDGEMTEQSMIATEYFKRGTEPTEQCTLHVE